MEYIAPVIFGPLENWREQYPQWNESRVWACRQIGDCYALVADSILTLAQPFPGDELLETMELRPELHFQVIKAEPNSEYIIQDHFTHKDIVIGQSLLERPHFNLGRWYAKQTAAPTLPLKKSKFSQA